MAWHVWCNAIHPWGVDVPQLLIWHGMPLLPQCPQQTFILSCQLYCSSSSPESVPLPRHRKALLTHPEWFVPITPSRSMHFCSHTESLCPTPIQSVCTPCCSLQEALHLQLSRARGRGSSRGQPGHLSQGPKGRHHPARQPDRPQNQAPQQLQACGLG